MWRKFIIFAARRYAVVQWPAVCPCFCLSHSCM